jgi:nitrate reductase delta subunit
MDGDTTRKRTFQLLAGVLEYPQPGLAEAVRECTALLAADNLAAAACLREFGAFVEETPPGRLEEIYTGTFDLDAACYPYVGYHLFGESYQRSLFMLGLSERYRAQGFPAGGLRSAIAGELPDHLAVLLHFLAACDDAALAGELVRDALLPALKRMGVDGDLPVPSPVGTGEGQGHYGRLCRGGGLVARMGAVTAPPLDPPRRNGGEAGSLPRSDVGRRSCPQWGRGGGEPQERARQGYRLVLQALDLVLQQFPANTLQQEVAPMITSKGAVTAPLSSTAENEESAGKIPLKSQHYLRRIKAVFSNIAKRKANDRHAKEQRLAGYLR